MRRCAPCLVLRVDLTIKCSALALLCAHSNTFEIHAQREGVWCLDQLVGPSPEAAITGAQLTSVCWAPRGSSIVSCSTDGYCHVWRPFGADTREYRSTPVPTRLRRGATTVVFRREGMFAVGSHEKRLVVIYDNGDGFWPAKIIRGGFRSSVVCLAWHPSAPVLAAGSTDGTCRLFLAPMLGEITRERPFVACGWGTSAASKSFGELLCVLDCHTSWIHSVQFSSLGTKLAFVTHDSILVVVDDGHEPCVTRARGLPFTTLVFVNERMLLAAGHGEAIAQFGTESVPGQCWTELVERTDEGAMLSSSDGDDARAEGARQLCAAVLRDGSVVTVSCASWDGRLSFWPVDTHAISASS